MSQFFGNHENRLDAKGRVSVPASFRAAMKSDLSTIALILRPSYISGCIEVWPQAAYQRWQTTLDALDHFDPKREALATLLYSEAWMVETDKEGRIMIPGELAAYAGLKDAVNFMGRGDHFHIWEPHAGAAFRKASRAMAPGFAPQAIPA
ncbi:MAG: division/cell wall cluster transcriptional repressor MraZ [Acidocella sp.]|nr:division/cell wall cluster transcriptional repressor MraZ [Acidocella sp.]